MRMNTNETQNTHIPVLLQECVDALNITADGVYVDGTLGGAGHAEAIASQLSPSGTFIGCDVDHDAIMRAQERLKKLPCHKFFVHDNFKNISHIVDQLGIQSVSGILLDLGWSSFQIADPERGLSFMHDGPLDMNLSKGMSVERLTAYEIVNHWGEETLADIFYAYGDEVKARQIAKHLVKVRREYPITTTKQLADEVIAAVYTKRKDPTKELHFKIHPATKVFQALRIAVNDELETIKEAIHVGIKKLASGGRFAIITFHSGEDRIVKHLFKQYADEEIIKLTVKKPIVPTLTETRTNPRSRSAKLRIVEKI
jgi:16S rRNA (cytosine1402-N4)-methyltransferase